MWIDPATGQLGSNDTVGSLRYSLFAVVYLLMAIDLAPVFRTARASCVHDLVTGTVVERA